MKKKIKEYAGGISINTPLFKKFIALMGEKDPQQFEEICLTFGPKRLRKIRRYAKAETSRLRNQDFVITNLNRVIKGIDKLFHKMQKKRKKK